MDTEVMNARYVPHLPATQISVLTYADIVGMEFAGLTPLAYSPYLLPYSPIFN